MAGLNKLWSRFCLTEEEEGGAKVLLQVETVIHQLTSKFFTKRVLNVDVVARTFNLCGNLMGNLKYEILVIAFYSLNLRMP